jgi:hypothetical protein
MAKTLIDRIKEELANTAKLRTGDPKPDQEPNDRTLTARQPMTIVEELQCKSFIRELQQPAKSNKSG